MFPKLLNSFFSFFLKKLIGSKSDLLLFIQEAERQRILDPASCMMIQGILDFSDMEVREIMVPRTDFVALRDNESLESLLTVILQSHHSRFPLLSKEDEITGVVLAKDLLQHVAQSPKAPFDVSEYQRPCLFVPERARLNTVLQKLRSRRSHIAMVMDEFGSVTGLLTIEDILEQIVGSIDDEHDFDEGGLIRKIDDERYIVHAHINLEDFNIHFQTQLNNEHYETLSGWLIESLGHRIPKRGEVFENERYIFKILRTDARRILTVQVKTKVP